MNPYLEQEDAWHDFHERFIPWVADIIAAQVDPRYIVKIDEHIYIHEMARAQPRFMGRADIAVTHSSRQDGPQTAAAVLDAPMECYLPAVDIERVSFVEIRDRRNRQLVTLVELLSPANKRPGSDRDQYLAKRNEVLASSAHFLEIDLLRGGRRMPVEGMPRCDYCVLLSRQQTRPRAGIWPLELCDRLPVVPIPLREPDPDAHLDLQEVLHAIYDRAHYETYIYEGAPDPLLEPEDEEWARQLVPPSLNFHGGECP
jgi:hypothetical protein